MRTAASSLLFLSLLSAVGPAFAAETTQDPFSYGPAIEYAMSRNMLNVLSDGEFHPEQPISRIDIVTSVVRDVYSADITKNCFDRIAPAVPAKFTHLFTDVPKTASAATELCVGMFVGIVDGRANGSFGPLGTANLVEAAKIVTKAYGIAPKPSLRLQSGIPWHEPYWFALARRSAIPESVKSRNAMLTRGEFAEILYRLRSERPAQGFKYVPGQVSRNAQVQGVVIAEPVSAIEAPVSVAAPVAVDPAPIVADAPASMSSGITLQMHVEERRIARLTRISQVEAPEPPPESGSGVL